MKLRDLIRLQAVIRAGLDFYRALVEVVDRNEYQEIRSGLDDLLDYEGLAETVGDFVRLAATFRSVAQPEEIAEVRAAWKKFTEALGDVF